MPRVSDLQRRAGVDARTKGCAALMLMLNAVDVFQLSKTDKGVVLTVYVQLFKHTLSGNTLFDLEQPLGDWLCSLPKGVWNEK